MSATKPVIVVVINKAGKVGKSTISKQLVTPMLNADWIQVETFNDTGQGAKAKVAGQKFEFVAQEVIGATKSMCIDVGNSNYKAVIKELKEIDGFAARIHLWVVPCKESAGVMNDSLSTVSDLINLGVDRSRIVILPNDVEAPEDGLDNFKQIELAAKKFGFHFCRAAVPQNPKFDDFNKDERSVFEIAADETDYDAEIAAANDEERHRLTQLSFLQGRARSLARQLTQVWAALPIASMVGA